VEQEISKNEKRESNKKRLKYRRLSTESFENRVYQMQRTTVSIIKLQPRINFLELAN